MLWGNSNTVEVCDGLDNDCDGSADEGLSSECIVDETRPCGSNIENCIHGTKLLVAGKWSLECTGGAGLLIEVCDDGQDNDCNGIYDNN